MANNGHGGARAGSGRKPKAAEDDLQKLLKKCVTRKDREDIFTQLARDARSQAFSVRHKSRELLFNYLYGKPVNSVEQAPEPEDNLAPPIGDAIERIYGGDSGTGTGG